MRKKSHSLEIIKPFRLSEPPRVLFLGNGINRLDYSDSRKISLEQLLEKLRKDLVNKEALAQLPFPLQAQCIRLLLKEHYDNKITDLCLDWCNEVIKDDKQQLINNLLSDNSDNKFDAVITANYSYEIEKSLLPDVNKEFVKKEDYSIFYNKNKRSRFFDKYRNWVDEGESTKVRDILHSFLAPNDDGYSPLPLKAPYVWHFHGEAENFKHIVLDLHSYGNNLSEIQGYISKFIRRVMISVNNNEYYKPKSWVDYFLLGEVSIIGFSFDFNEFDLWWLLDERRKVIEILKQRLSEKSKKNNKRININFGEVTFFDMIVQKGSSSSPHSVTNTDNNSSSDSSKNKYDSNLKETAFSALNAKYVQIEASSFEEAYKTIPAKMKEIEKKKNK